jgi:transcriptional regulator with XRE-family HTH domain
VIERRTVTKLKLAIVRTGVAQKDIAAELGMDQAHLSRIVNGLHADDATREAITDVLRRHLPDLQPTDVWDQEAAA